jgi:hypothetical protein
MVPAMVKDRSKIPAYLLSQEHELRTLRSAADMLADRTNLLVKVVLEDDSKQQKAAGAMPGKPAIVLS